VALSANGELLVSGGADPNKFGEVKVWDMATGKVNLTLKGHKYPVRSVAVSADGSIIVSASGDLGSQIDGKAGPGELKVWDAATGKVKFNLEGHKSGIESVALSADGNLLASAGWGEKACKVWDVVTGQEKGSVEHDNSTGVRSVAFSADGMLAASTAGADITNMPSELKVWNPITGKVQLFLKGEIPVRCVAISPDGQFVASAGDFFGVWDVTTGKQKFKLQGHLFSTGTLAFGSDGKLLVSARGQVPLVHFSVPDQLKLWDLATGQEKLSLRGHKDAVTSIAVSVINRYIVSGSKDGTVKVWEAPPVPK
jgi:WD40 repeat protein